MQNDGREANFHTTHWSLVLAAACQNQAPEGRTALAELCQVYWYPLYAHVRRRGYGPEDAKDLTQGFFLHLIKHEALTQVDVRKGKFRSFLLALLNNFLSVAHRRDNAVKRGGGHELLSLDVADAEGRYRIEPADQLSAEHTFDARWALSLLQKDPQKRPQDPSEVQTAAEKIAQSLTERMVFSGLLPPSVFRRRSLVILSVIAALAAVGATFVIFRPFVQSVPSGLVGQALHRARRKRELRSCHLRIYLLTKGVDILRTGFRTTS
jgi:RNA polymerase sigma-70 factor (ECF subfamily)